MFLLLPLLATQGLWVKYRTPRLPPAVGSNTGAIGAGALLRLLALGDSIMAGVGVAEMSSALPARLSAHLARRLGRTVVWKAHGRNGARTADILHRLARTESTPADVVVISNGINEVTSFNSTGRFLAAKERLYSVLRRRYPAAWLFQLGLPPMAHFPGLPQPLRACLGRRAQVFDEALEALIADMTRIRHLSFSSTPDAALFAADGYHPNAAGIEAWAAHLAQSMEPLVARTGR